MLFKNLLGHRGLSNNFLCRCAKWVFLGGHFQSLQSDGAGSGNDIVGGSREVGILISRSIRLLAEKNKMILYQEI